MFNKIIATTALAGLAGRVGTTGQDIMKMGSKIPPMFGFPADPKAKRKGPSFASNRPIHTKNIFLKWVPGAPHMHVENRRDRRTGERKSKVWHTPTKRATYDMKALAKHKALYARTHNFKGEVAR